MIVENKNGERFSVFRSLDQQKRMILVMGKLTPVEPVTRLAIASGANPDLWHIEASSAVSFDDVLKYYKLTKV